MTPFGLVNRALRILGLQAAGVRGEKKRKLLMEVREIRE